MKRKNNKGFTLIEILAAIVILGIISTIAVPAVYKYVTKTKDFSYENMYKTVYDAVKNYRIDTNDVSANGITAPTYTKADINNFVELNYLDPLIDPADRSKKCSAEVYVFVCNNEDKTVLEDHSYSVQLTCSAYSDAKVFNDNGDLLSDAEIASCIGGGDGNVGNFTVEDADLKYEDKNGADYDGKWTNKNVWLGNFKVKGINLSDVDHFEYSTAAQSSVDVNAEAVSLGTNAKQYRFTGETNVSFRVRAVDKNGRVSVWSDKVFRVRIDRVSPEVTMELIDSSDNFTSPTYKGTATSNTYTHDGWVGSSGSTVPNVRISAKDDKSGINEELKVNYNTSGDFSNFNTNWNGVSGSKKFKDGNIFIANGLDDGFRVIECTVTDKAGNKTTGTIKVKIDTTAPEVTMKIVNSNNNFTSSFKGTSTKNVYIHDSWVGKSDSGNPKVRISAEDNGAGINEEFDIKYNATDDYSNFNTNWTNQSGSRKFKTNNKFTSKEIGGGFRVIECTVTDKAGNLTRGTIKVKIDTVAPSVTMAMVYGDNKSTTGCTSKKFTGSGDGNTDTCSDWVKKNENNKVKVMITATDSGKLKDNLEVYYNTAGDYKNFNKMWNNSSGSKNFESDSTFTSNEIIDGYRVIKCVVKDEAGNTTEGIINVKIDTKPPTIKLDLKTASKSTLLKSYSCSDSTCDKSYTNGDNDWVNKSVKDTVSFSDNGSGTSSLKARYNEAGKSSNNGKMSEWSTRENDSSVTIKDGDRYMEYQATDVAGNTTTLKFSVKKDTEPPKIKVSFIGNKNNDNKTMFTADFTATDDENRSEYASSLEYEYDPWVNSYNDIVGETITVSDALSGVKKDAKIKRTLYNSTYSYTKALKNAATTTDDWSYTSNYERTIKYSDTYLADGYRVFTYQVKDQAGNVATYKVKFKIDKTPPTGWVQVLDKDGKAIAFKSDGTTQITQKVTFSKTLTDLVGLKIHGEDVTSGVGAYFNIGFNKPGKTTCAIDDTINTTYSYSFSDITYNNDDISTKATRVIKNAFYNGCRYFKVTLTDIAGNKKTIKIALTQNTNQATETVAADTNPVGCHYYDYYVRRTGYSWGCTCGSTHSSSTGAHFIVCKHTDGKYYGKKEYYRKVKNNKTKQLGPTLICPDSPKPADGDIAKHKYLSKKISDTINWDYYGSTVSGKKWSNW